MNPWGRRVTVVAVWAATVAAASGVGPGEIQTPRSCRAAVAVDGGLRCDDEAPADLRALCGPDSPAIPIARGDAVRSAAVCAAPTPRRGGPGWGRLDPESLAALAQPVDVNAADVAELSSLPGIGPTLAGRIVDARPIATVDDLRGVRGIGPKRMARLRARVRLGPSPVR